MKKKKFFAKAVALLLLAGLLISQAEVSTFAAGSEEGRVIINQVYGASEDGYASHSFIELYNTSEETVDLNEWSLQYKSSESGNAPDDWMVCTLTGEIAAKGYYLVRCGAVTKPSGSYQIPEGNQEWDITLHNKGLSVVLMKNSKKLTAEFSGNIMAEGFHIPEGFADMAAVQGNDGEENQTPPAWEGDYADIQSKKKSIRRIGFQDTDNNREDFVAVDYSKGVSTDDGPHAGNTVVPPTYVPVETTDEKYYGFFNDTASLRAELIARYNAGAYSADGGSAEISVYNSGNGFIYSVNGVKGTLDCVDLKSVSNTEKVGNLSGTELSAARLAESTDTEFTYGDITSVAVSSDKSRLAVALQDADYTKTGRVLLFECTPNGTLNFAGMARTGVQPDMVCFNENDTLLLTADEGEPRMGQNETDPIGSVTMINTADMSSEIIDFTAFDEHRDSLIAKGIVIQKNTAPSVDFEPEYIAVSGNRAYVSLQEANAIAVLDLDAKTFLDIYSVGFEDYSKVPVDLNKGDKKYQPTTYANIKGIRMPDGISTCTINGETYLLTANEGDSRAWPAATEEFVNEVKSDTSPVNGIKMDKKVTWFDAAQYDGLENDMDYVFGARSFTIFKVTEAGLTEVFDSGSQFEEITASVLPEHFNCSNEVIDTEDRSGKKGSEPESVIVGTVGERTYAFVALERIGGVMMYDITEPDKAVFENYINSRDFSTDIKNDVSPEGLYFIAESDSPLKAPLLAVSNEVSGTISIVELNSGCVHDWETDYTVDVEATCVKEGIESIHCKKCDETKDSRPIPVNPNNHDIVHHEGKTPTATEVGWKAYDTCKNCSYSTYEALPATGHEDNHGGSTKPNETQPPHNSETNSSAVQNTQSTEANDSQTQNTHTADANAPKTGDNSSIWVWVLIVLAAGLGIAGVTVYNKRKSENV